MVTSYNESIYNKFKTKPIKLVEKQGELLLLENDLTIIRQLHLRHLRIYFVTPKNLF